MVAAPWPRPFGCGFAQEGNRQPSGCVEYLQIAVGIPLHVILPGMKQRALRLISLLSVVLVAAAPAAARVIRVEILSRKDVLESKTFGEAGAYERITGRVYFSVPIANPHNQRIVDLDKAINLKEGEVEFSADFIAVRPK